MMSVSHAADVLLRGGVIAYPTEGVFGLGCLPSDQLVVARVLDIKRRDALAALELLFGKTLPYLLVAAVSAAGSLGLAWLLFEAMYQWDVLPALPDSVRALGEGRLDSVMRGLIQDSVETLLGEESELIDAFRGGSYMTIYLAPHNYHRVHTPIAGRLDRGRYIPGKRYSVNAKTAARIDGLYCRNERVVLWISAATGYAVVVMVGALNVASLTTALSGEIESGAERVLASEAPPALARGDEVGRFNLGSTIVMLFPRGTVEWLDSLVPDQPLRMGQAVGRIKTPPNAG